jgi:hypothetical protein
MTASATTRTALASAALAAAGLALSACTAQSEEARTAASAETAPEGRQCFYAGSVSGFRKAPGDNQVYIDVLVRDTYLFETFGSCPDLNFTETLGLKGRTGNFICDAMDVDLIVPDAIAGSGRCPVRMIRKLAPGEPGVR